MMDGELPLAYIGRICRSRRKWTSFALASNLNKMEGNPIEYNSFLVYPEYGLTVNKAKSLSKEAPNKILVSSALKQSYNVGFAMRNGKFLYHRPKCRLYTTEARSDMKSGHIKPELKVIDNLNVLLLICYEMMFPKDYWREFGLGIDLVIHLVGFPMFDDAQKEAWKALQEAISITARCPVVCCCGGDVNDPMNITGVTTYELL